VGRGGLALTLPGTVSHRVYRIGDSRTIVLPWIAIVIHTWPDGAQRRWPPKRFMTRERAERWARRAERKIRLGTFSDGIPVPQETTGEVEKEDEDE
jgi:hypothetical protein